MQFSAMFQTSFIFILSNCAQISLHRADILFSRLVSTWRIFVEDHTPSHRPQIEKRRFVHSLVHSLLFCIQTFNIDSPLNANRVWDANSSQLSATSVSGAEASRCASRPCQHFILTKSRAKVFSGPTMEVINSSG